MDPQPIHSRKRFYPVGSRDQYVYWLVQSMPAGLGRDDNVKELIGKYRLTEEEQANLARRLAALDASRAEPEPPRQVDPYWSLWGKLKARHRRDHDHRERVAELEEVGCRFYDEVADYAEGEYERMRGVLSLPRRDLEVEWDGQNLEIDGRTKKVKGDNHAVNFLRKLDTDDDYFAEFMDN